MNYKCLHLALLFLEHLICHAEDFSNQFIETNSLKEVICGNESDVPSLISWEGSVRTFDTLTFIIHAQKPWFFMPASRWGFDKLWRVFGGWCEHLNPPPDLWKRTRCSFTPLSPESSSLSCRLHKPASNNCYEETRRVGPNKWDRMIILMRWITRSHFTTKSKEKMIK